MLQAKNQDLVKARGAIRNILANLAGSGSYVSQPVWGLWRAFGPSAGPITCVCEIIDNTTSYALNIVPFLRHHHDINHSNNLSLSLSTLK